MAYASFGALVSVATVLTVYGIETRIEDMVEETQLKFVATVLTVYGIETYVIF